jgi:hypothetical protein
MTGEMIMDVGVWVLFIESSNVAERQDTCFKCCCLGLYL